MPTTSPLPGSRLSGTSVGTSSLDGAVFGAGVRRDVKREEPLTNCEGQLSPEGRRSFHQKIAMVGYGVYGRALHTRLKEGFDILPWERPAPNRPHNDLVTHDLATAIDGRGLMILAVPSNAFPNVLERMRPHQDTVVVSLAKGLIVPGWEPLASEQSLREGPAIGSKALTSLEYLRQHPNWSHVADNLVFVAGPGFAKDVQEGGYVGLTVSAKPMADGKPSEALAKAFWLFSGMSGDKNIEVFNNPTAVEVSSSMKNVAAFAAGILLGIMKTKGALETTADGGFKITKRVEIKHGDSSVMLDSNSLHRLSQFAGREIINIVKSEGGGKGVHHMMAGGHDLNLTLNSLTSRNVQAGMRLACGENIYDILSARDAQGHRLTAEGVIATHAMACRIQNNSNEAFAPLVFALRNILMGRSTPESLMAHYFAQTRHWTHEDAQYHLNGTAKKPLSLRLHGGQRPGQN